MGDSTDRETSFNQCLNDISGLSDDEYTYGEMSFPQWSDNINDLSSDELVVNETSTPSETNSSDPITYDGVLEWVLDCYQNSDAYPGLVRLNQLADEVLQVRVSNNVSEAPVNVESAASSVEDGGYIDSDDSLDGSEALVSSVQYGGCIDDDSMDVSEASVSSVQYGGCIDDDDILNASEAAVSSVQNGVHIDQDSIPNAPEVAGPSLQNGGNVNDNQNASTRVVSRPVFNNIELSRSLVLPRPSAEADYTSYHGSMMVSVHDMLDEAFSLAEREDLVQIELRGEQLQGNVSAILSANHDSNLNDFDEALFNAVQSNWAVMADSDLELMVQIVHSPRGGGGEKRMASKMLDNEIVKKKKRFLYIVHNPSSQLCFAINLALLLHDNLTDNEGFERGREIQRGVGLTDQTAVTFADIEKFEENLKCKIVVFYRGDGDRTLCKFQTDCPKRDKTVFLFLFENHYYGIKNLKGFLGVSIVCEYCYTGYNSRWFHSCKGHCFVCLDPSCTLDEFKPIFCKDCNKTCRTVGCHARHKEQTQRATAIASNCDLHKKCVDCQLSYYIPKSSADKTHKCQVQKCKTCGEKLPAASPGEGVKHLCYIGVLPKETEHNDHIVFYDFETMAGADGVHAPFLVCTKTLAGETWVAEGTDCALQFLDHFRRPKFKNATFIAHNAKGFDSYLIINAMIEQGLKPSLIMQGSKVISFTDQDFRQKYIDSLSYLSMRLAAMPKALGFEDKIKGYFPHGFSSKANLSYIGPYPPAHCYGIERMTTDEKSAFFAWYETVRTGTFDFRKQALLYCKNDVDILAQGCTLFRKGFLEETGVDPFSRATIASACMKVFTTNFLPLKTLAIPPPDDYRRENKTYSCAGIQWLDWVAHTEGVFIQHALNEGEKRVGRFVVDGFAEVEGVKTVWEFLGCFYHGCPSCYKGHEKNPLTGGTFERLHAASEEKLHELQSVHGAKVIVMREHTWGEMKKSNQDLQAFLREYKAPEPLTPRAALYGGRTCAVKLRYTAAADELIHYCDFTSLYPFVNCTGLYPLGHPQIIFRDFKDPQSYFGLIRATVDPPRGLYFPVLPYKTAAGKLVFTLCRTCAELNNQQGPCTHGREERALTGVWVTTEFNKALNMGYKLTQITEVWHFENKSASIFVDYIHTFLKGKQEASGYPSEATDDESRQKYVTDYHANQGIQLDAAKITANPAKRQVSKLCLNSFWGKFAQRSNLTQTKIVTKPEEFLNLLFSAKHKVKYFSFINDRTALVQWCYGDDGHSPPNKVDNIFIAAFTTAYARLKLYSELEKLQHRVFYYDTDSIIYVTRPGETPLPMGVYLGDLTDELGGDTIKEFVSAGPKSYAYQTKNQKKVVMRVKGITQTHECCERVNFDSLTDLVEGYVQNTERGRVLEVPQHNIVRNKEGFVLRNVSFTKKFRVVFDKRRLLDGGDTLPFGY